MVNNQGRARRGRQSAAMLLFIALSACAFGRARAQTAGLGEGDRIVMRAGMAVKTQEIANQQFAAAMNNLEHIQRVMFWRKVGSALLLAALIAGIVLSRKAKGRAANSAPADASSKP